MDPETERSTKQASDQSTEAPKPEILPSSDDPSLSADLGSELSQVAELARFSRYLNYRPMVEDDAKEGLEALQDRVRPQFDNLRNALAEKAALPRRPLRWREVQVFGPSLIAVAALTVAALGLVGDSLNRWLFPFIGQTKHLERDQRWTWVIALGIAGAAISAVVGSYNAEVVRATAADRVVDAARNAYQVALRAAAIEAYTQSINHVLGPMGKLTFPETAPRLVELDTSVVVPSSTYTYVRDFIDTHESSAIGIAGPRGCGKSTLMKELSVDKELPHAECCDVRSRQVRSSGFYPEVVFGCCQ